MDEHRKQVQKENEQKTHFQERFEEAEKYIEELKAKNLELENLRPNPGNITIKTFLSVIVYVKSIN